MKFILTRWPEALLLLGIVFGGIALVGCSAMQEITPTSQAALERQAQVTGAYIDASIMEAEAGNTTNSVGFSLASIVSMLLGTAGMSRRRRKSATNDVDRAESVERGNALRAAGMGKPPPA